jgi:hypothetical protein
MNPREHRHRDLRGNGGSSVDFQIASGSFDAEVRQR